MATPMVKFATVFAVNLRQNTHHIGCLQKLSALLVPHSVTQTTCPLRNNYVDWRMRRDAKRREMTKRLFSFHLQKLSALLIPHSVTQTTCPVRTNYVDWRMRRDAKRREMTKEYSQERRLLNCIRKNTILPEEVKSIADQEIASFPRDSCHVRIRDRCAITSRPRWVLKSWRLSRIVWREEADGNRMSGIQRAKW